MATSKDYSPTEPPSNGKTPSPTLSSSPNLGDTDDLLSTDVCKSKFKAKVQSFIKNLENDKDPNAHELAMILEKEDISSLMEGHTIEEILEIMRKNKTKEYNIFLKEKSEHEALINEKKAQYKKIKAELKEIKEKIMTKNREYEFDESRYRLMLYETNLLKQFLICIVVLFSFGLLKQSNMLPNAVVISLYFVTLLGAIGFFVYKYKQNRKNKVKVNSNEIEFKEPEKTN